jgi:hypothetical protein
MNLDIDFLIKFYKNNTKSESKEEFTEAEGEGSSAPSGGSTMPQWADIVGGPVRGKANMLGKDGEVWSTGVKRGVSNQTW